jgi:hypothetical protein
MVAHIQTTVVVGEASSIIVNTVVTDASCGNANGTAQVNANGGTGAFGFQWSTGAATTTINGLTAGGLYRYCYGCEWMYSYNHRRCCEFRWTFT